MLLASSRLERWLYDDQKIASADELLQKLFDADNTRVAHSREVAGSVATSLDSLGMASTHLFSCTVAAALLHDIGYAPSCIETGFHPVDGYRFLRQVGLFVESEIMLSHSCTPEEGELRGFAIQPSNSLPAMLLTFWDMQVGPNGRHMSYDERLEEIRSRYSPDSIVCRANRMAEPRLRSLIKNIHSMLDEANRSTDSV